MRGACRLHKPRLIARSIRRVCGLSLKAVGEATDLGFSHLARFERGEAAFGVEKLRRLAAFYGERLGHPVTMELLHSEEGPM